MAQGYYRISSFSKFQKSLFILNEAINFNEKQVKEHSCGSLNIICQFCKSSNFIYEHPSDGKFTSYRIKRKPIDIYGK